MVVLSKRVFHGRYQWPRKSSDAWNLDREQFFRLMEGFSIDKSIPACPPGQD